MINRHLVKSISQKFHNRHHLTQHREASKAIIYLALIGGAAYLYLNQGYVVQSLRDYLNKKEVSNKTNISDLLSDDVKKQAAETILNSMTPEERAKLLEKALKNKKET
mmetsp:Transcript_9475/g.8479  ORF Transcript_9475/g.8479 Transcript_9475/m.8479 type:complete len:108 (-) Transcript_9475:75-398(-)